MQKDGATMAKDVIHIAAIITVNSRKLFRENRAGFMGNRMAQNLSAVIVTILNIETIMDTFQTTSTDLQRRLPSIPSTNQRPSLYALLIFNGIDKPLESLDQRWPCSL